jgi:hypothetical protein
MYQDPDSDPHQNVMDRNTVLKSGQDPDPDLPGSALVWLRGSGSGLGFALRRKDGSESTLKPMRIHIAVHNFQYFGQYIEIFWKNYSLAVLLVELDTDLDPAS